MISRAVLAAVLLSLALCGLATATGTLSARRGLYVSLYVKQQPDHATMPPGGDVFNYILGDAQKEGELLDFVKQQKINVLSLYNLVNILPKRTEALRAFVKRARKAGVARLEGIGSWQLSEWKAMLTYQNETPDPDARFDGFLTEIEFWNGDGAYDDLLAALQYMRDGSPKNSSMVDTPYYAAYIGWPSDANLTALCGVVDLILVHAYVKNPATSFEYTQKRLETILSVETIPDVAIIYSAEGQYFTGDQPFMGDWLASNHSVPEAEQVFRDVAKKNGTEMWGRLEPHFRGFQWFEYFQLRYYTKMIHNVTTTRPPAKGDDDDDAKPFWMWLVIVGGIALIIGGVVGLYFVWRDPSEKEMQWQRSRLLIQHGF